MNSRTICVPNKAITEVKTIESINDMLSTRRILPVPVALVPTMGYLHSGHLSLVKKAREENRSVVVSIFVNPAQFGPSEDFENYPRDIGHDLALLANENVDAVFIPAVKEMYPLDFSFHIEGGWITERLEGASRPGHFRGVTTVVAKLFNIIQPTCAYFGQKDAQQAAVIRKMVTDLNMNVEIKTCSTVREPDGLAMSSRNTYLKPSERRAATILYRALILSEKLWKEGEKNAKRIRNEMKALIDKEPMASVDYISLADGNTMNEVDEACKGTLVSLAVKIGNTRLIDNTILE